METFLKISLIAHATAGGVSLLSGLMAIITKKGSKKHLKSGIVYYWGMMMVVITGLILGFAKLNYFILTIAVFSFYMVFTGRRILAFKKAIQPAFIDWFFNIISLLIAGFMLYLGIVNLIRIGFAGAVPMLLVFGSLLGWMVVVDLIILIKKKHQKGAWILTHIGRMGGSYIATTTAFLVVNINFNPQWIIWLLPTVIGFPLISGASRKWRKKMKPAKA